MALFDEIRKQGAAYRLTEEMLFAEVLREIDAGVRRDGLWAKALSDTGMDENKAKALYIKLRVRSLKDEANLLLAQSEASGSKTDVEPTKAVARRPTSEEMRAMQATKPSDGSAPVATMALWLFALILIGLVMSALLT